MSDHLVIGEHGFIDFDGKTYCPRRRESLHGTVIRKDEGDTWKQYEDGVRCEWCGSMSPEELFLAIESGTEIGPTDKDYKVYVGSRGKFYFQHFSEAHMRRFIGLYNGRDEHGKRTMNIGFPSHFYRMPFFMKLKPQ